MAMNLCSLFRRLRKVCDSYMDDMTLGELQDLVEHLQQNRREAWRGRPNLHRSSRVNDNGPPPAGSKPKPPASPPTASAGAGNEK